jgi:hypothetical protein
MKPYLRILENAVSDPNARCLVVTHNTVHATLLFEELRQLPGISKANYSTLMVHFESGATISVKPFPDEPVYWGGLCFSTILYNQTLTHREITFLLGKLRSTTTRNLTMVPIMHGDGND